MSKSFILQKCVIKQTSALRTKTHKQRAYKLRSPKKEKQPQM